MISPTSQHSKIIEISFLHFSPNLLVLDEPTNHLDVETISALADALHQFQGGVILVSHDERLIETVCNEVWVCTRMGQTQASDLHGSRVYSLKDGLPEYKKAVRTELDQMTK